MFSRRIFLAALLASFSWGAASLACDFCQSERGPTIAADYFAADVVLLVRVEQGPVFDDVRKTYCTDVTIDRVIKEHGFIKGKKTIRLKREIPKIKSQILLFCEVWKDSEGKEQIDAHRGVEVPVNSELVKYFEESIVMRSKPVAERLRFSFEFLNNSNPEIAMDAYREFAMADYKDYMTIAKTFPAERVAGWLKDPKTPSFRCGLYGSLLGHCGNASHASLLRSKIDEAIRKKSSELFGLLAGYFMLDSRGALSFMKDVLRDDEEGFFVRSACLQTATFLRDQRPDVLPLKELTAAVALVLGDPYMADIGIDFLRKSRAWERTAQIIDLCGKKTTDKDYDNDLVKRAVVRFALVSPDPQAVAFIIDMRARSPRHAEFVNTTLELLKLDD